jgi:hypothetical protein
VPLVKTFKVILVTEYEVRAEDHASAVKAAADRAQSALGIDNSLELPRVTGARVTEVNVSG